MSIIIDVVLLAIIAVSAFFAAKKGFIGTLFSLLGTVVAVVLAVSFCTPVSGFIDSNFVNPTVKSYIVKTVDSTSIGKSYEEAISNSGDVIDNISKMPESLKAVLDLAGINADEIVNEAKKAQSNADSVDTLINKVASPISSTISKVVALVGLFVILFAALWVVCKLLTAVFGALPIAKRLNTFGGLAFGIARGLLIVFVISTFFIAISKGVAPDSNNLFSNKTIESTYLLKTVSDFNPINSVLNIK